MLGRREVLVAGAALAAMPGRVAMAEQRRTPLHGRSRETVPAGTAATTPLGPIDTAAKFALILDVDRVLSWDEPTTVAIAAVTAAAAEAEPGAESEGRV